MQYACFQIRQVGINSVQKIIFPKPIQIFQFNVQFGILSVALIHYKIKNISTYVEFLLKNIDSVGICIIWYIYYMFRPST